MAEEKKKKEEDPYIDPNYKPYEDRGVKHPTTDFETFIHLIKGSLGSGVLAMPEAFMNMGTWTGIIMTMIVSFIVGYCIHILVKCAHIIYHRRQIPRLNFPEVAEASFLDVPGLEKYARYFRFLVSLFLFIDLYGVCCIYMVLIGRNVKQVIEFYSDVHISVRIWIIIFTIPLLFMCLVRNLKYIVPFSAIANVLVFYCVIATFTFIVRDLPPISEREAMAPLARWPLFMGTVIFALENVGIVMGLENDMKTPNHMIGCPSVLVCAFSLVVVIYGSLGFFGYWKYGSETMSSVSLNLPHGDVLAQTVKMGIGFAIFFTYTLQYYVPLNIAWNTFKHKVPPERERLYNSAFRILLVVGASTIGSVLPHLGPLISLCGAVCLSTLGLMAPSVVELAVYWKFPGYGTLKWRLWKNIALIIFGTGIFISGTYYSILEMKAEMDSGSYEKSM